MELYSENLLKLKKQKEFLEKKLHIKIKIKGKRVLFSGEPLEEYEASLVLDAIDFGFPVETAILLIDESLAFEKINIKE